MANLPILTKPRQQPLRVLVATVWLWLAFLPASWAQHCHAATELPADANTENGVEEDCCIPFGGMVVNDAASLMTIACEDTADISFSNIYDPWRLRYSTTISSAECTLSLNHDPLMVDGQNHLPQEQAQRMACLSPAHQQCLSQALSMSAVQSLQPPDEWLQPEQMPAKDVPYHFIYADQAAKNQQSLTLPFAPNAQGLSPDQQPRIAALAQQLQQPDAECQHIVIEAYAIPRPGKPLAASALSQQRALVLRQTLLKKGINSQRIFIAAYGDRFAVEQDQLVLRWRDY